MKFLSISNYGPGNCELSVLTPNEKRRTYIGFEFSIAERIKRLLNTGNVEQAELLLSSHKFYEKNYF